ncbi:hypothetical protein Drorol1_Dr00011907 [Drosera rotundifolia]
MHRIGSRLELEQEQLVPHRLTFYIIHSALDLTIGCLRTLMEMVPAPSSLAKAFRSSNSSVGVDGPSVGNVYLIAEALDRGCRPRMMQSLVPPCAPVAVPWPLLVTV